MRIRVVGKGPVALSFGLLMRRQGVPAARIELDVTRAPLPPSLALRTLALSAGSWQLLSRVSALAPSAPITSIDISLQGRAGRARLDAAEHRLAALGYVVRYPALSEALLDAASHVGFADPGSAAPDSGTLIVHAEGDTGEDAEQRDFAQSAIICELTVRGQHTGMAYERFTADGPLALLPLPEPNRHALVWCCRPEQAERRAAAPTHAFIDELNAFLGPRLRVLHLDSARPVMPLVRRRRKQASGTREIWIGNAAQSLHPVAGQGFNLGLRDAFVLASEIGRRDAPSSADAVSARYALARRADRKRTVDLTDLLARAFTVRPLHKIESMALIALDLHHGAKAWLARQMMFGVR